MKQPCSAPGNPVSSNLAKRPGDSYLDHSLQGCAGLRSPRLVGTVFLSSPSSAPQTGQHKGSLSSCMEMGGWRCPDPAGPGFIQGARLPNCWQVERGHAELGLLHAARPPGKCGGWMNSDLEERFCVVSAARSIIDY